MGLKENLIQSNISFNKKYNEVSIPFRIEPNYENLSLVVNSFAEFLKLSSLDNFYINAKEEKFEDFTKYYFYIYGKSLYEDFIKGKKNVSLYEILSDFEYASSDYIIDNYSFINTTTEQTEFGARIRQESVNYPKESLFNYYSLLKSKDL